MDDDGRVARVRQTEIHLGSDCILMKIEILLYLLYYLLYEL